MAATHIIGAGLSGLSCALRLALAGRTVALYEAAGHPGGRCRSFVDDSLGCLIDNGSHMLMGANQATRAYMADIGTSNLITEIAPASYPFMDFETGERWRIRPTPGLVPRWILSSQRRVPGAGAGDYLSALRLARADSEDTIADCLGVDGPLYQRMWQPFSRAALNTDATEASARAMWALIRETFLRGERACRPLFFHAGLSPALIDPATRTLTELGVDIRFKARLRGIGWHDYRANALVFAEGTLRVAPEDTVVLAVPPEACRELWPDTVAPLGARAIVNVHFRLDEPARLPWDSPFLGLIGAETQWLFARDNILSLTISAADRHVERPGWELANLLWNEAAKVLGRNVGRVPPWRVIKERRATFAQTPADQKRRPTAVSSLRNLFIAGDWTSTGLPATIEGAIRSGFLAAQLVLQTGAEGKVGGQIG